jgi:hypothetical protein
MKSIKNQLLIVLFFLGIIIGPAYNTYVDYNFEHTTIDCKAYMNVANANFKEATITHRYRVIIPFIAKAVSVPVALVYKQIWPHRADGEWPLRIAFYLVNCITLALALYLLFTWLSSVTKGSPWVLLLACAALISSGRWYNYMAGLPLTDSLYVLVIIATCIAIQTQNWYWTLFCIFIGPWAKESYLFVAPLLFFFGASKWKQIPFWLLSGVFVFGMRYWIDSSIGIEATKSIEEYSGHFNDFAYTFKKLASVRGFGEICTVLGIFTFLIAWVFWKKDLRSNIPNYVLWLFPIFIFHAFLSGEAARMLAFATPLWGLCLVLGFEVLGKKLKMY